MSSQESTIEVITSAPPDKTFFTVNQMVQRHPFLTEGALRFQIFDRANNGLEESGALVCLGKRRLFDEPKYIGWVERGVEK